MDFLRKLLNRFLLSILDNRGTDVVAMDAMNSDTDSDLDANVPEIWQARLRLDAARKSFFGPLKGKEMSGKPIIEKDDFVNQAGDVIHIQVMTELYGPGVTGETTLRGAEDKLSTSQFNVVVDWLRKAVAVTKKVKKEVNFEVMQQTRTLISNWLARELDRQVFAQLLTNVSDTLYAGNATSSASLGSDDTFTTAELDNIRLAMDRKGAMPISVSNDGGQETAHFAVVISEVDAFNLRGDDRWLDAVKLAQIRSEKNPIFTGRPVEWNGLLVYTLKGVKAAGCIQGTPLRPECKLQTTINDAITNIVVGVSNTNAGQQKQYTQFFPSDGTLKIENEEMTYSSKTYYTFTVTSRGVNGTTNVAHTAGALITLRDISRVIAFGAEICSFAWGQHPQRIEDKDDYGFITGIGIETLYGVKAIEDSDGNKPNYLVMECFSSNPGSI